MTIKTYSLSISLHTEETIEFTDCLKEFYKENEDNRTEYIVSRNTIGVSGRIYTSFSAGQLPSWHSTVNSFLNEPDYIVLEENITNRAVIILKIDNRLMSLSFGQGKSMLDDSTIVQDFGIKVAANMVDPNQIRSLNSLNIEDIVLNIQRQSSTFSNQNQLQVNTFRDILKEVSGAPHRRLGDSAPKFIVGTDSLKTTKKMDITNIVEDLRFYLNEYGRNNYQNNQFQWLDNITRVKDKRLKQILDTRLEQAIIDNENNLQVAVNRPVDWGVVSGFFIEGYRLYNLEKNYTLEIKYDDYFEFIRKNIPNSIIRKLKSNKLFLWNTDVDMSIILASIYNSLIYECEYDDSRFLLTHGEWLEVDRDYYQNIKRQVERIEVEERLEFIPYDNSNKSLHQVDKYKEKHYNKDLSDSNKDFFLLDEKLFMIPGFGNSRIEPCDVITRNKELIHVKRYNGSSSLSHLLSQGLVSAQHLTRDDFKQHINDMVGEEIISTEDTPSDFKVIYAIVHNNPELNEHEIFPFFTMVNLVLTVEQLSQMGLKYSIKKIEVIN